MYRGIGIEEIEPLYFFLIQSKDRDSRIPWACLGYFGVDDIMLFLKVY